MATYFNAISSLEIMERLQNLQQNNPKLWGKMTAAQMMAHCSFVIEMAVGERTEKASFVEKLMSPLIKKFVFNPKPFKPNLPTGKLLLVENDKNFDKEKERLIAVLNKFFNMGSAIEQNKHVLFGKLTTAEWHFLTIKHLDHHLKQFNG